MKFGWTTDEEKIRRHMCVPARKKLEILQQMHALTLAASDSKALTIRKALRQRRSLGHYEPRQAKP